MIRPGRAGLLAAILLLALEAVSVRGAPARNSSGDTLKAKQEALGEVRRRLDAARARATAARTREASLLAELDERDRTLARTRGELKRLDQRLVRLQAELVLLDGRRGRVAEDTVALEGAVVSRLGVLDRLRHMPTPPGWLGEAADLTRARAIDDLGRVARVELRRLADFDETAERLTSRQEAATRGRRELVELRRAVEAERTAINEQVERRRELLTQVRDDRATHERVAGELAEASRRLEALVRELGRRARARPATLRPRDPGGHAAPTPVPDGSGPRPPAVGLGALRGQLPWPIQGRIVGGFGRQIHPRFGTETVRHGVDIEGEEGAVIRAVHAGVVLYRGWLKGYGNLIVLDHGQGYYTLYAHASEFLAAEGESVKAGQGIARVGETGSLADPRLYFEVRYQGRPEDPQQWLRRGS